MGRFFRQLQKRPFGRATAAAAAALVVLGAQSAAAEARLDGPLQDTWLVGVAPPGAHVAQADFSPEQRGVSRIVVKSRNGVFCNVVVGAEGVTGNGSRRRVEFNQCGGGGATSEDRSSQLRNDITFQGNSFIYGVAACMDASGQRIRGVGVRYARVNGESGRQNRSELFETYAHGDCAPGTWSRMAVCPAGAVASGVGAVFTGSGDRSGPHALTGLLLRCQQVVR